MPAASLTVAESNNTVQPSAGNVIACIGISSAGTPATVYAFDSDTAVVASLGNGPNTELTAKVVRVGKKRTLAVPVTQTVASTIGAVTETPVGTGPNITVTGTALDSFDVGVKITLAGAQGTARFKYSLDYTNPNGPTWSPELETAATYTIANTGIVLNFPAVPDLYGSADYVLDTVYSFSTVQPGFSTTDLGLAIQALVDSGEAFGLIAVDASHVSTGADLRTIADALDAKMTTVLGLKKYCRVLLGGAVDASDSSVKAAFASFTSSRVTVCGRGGWITGGTQPGSPKRSQVHIAAGRAAKARFSSDLGNGQDGPLEEVSALTADEYATTTKLRDFRFTVCETRPGLTGFYFSRGLTMAAPTSRYKHLNLARVMDAACTQAQADLNTYVNNDFVINPSGTIAEFEAKSIEIGMTANLKTVLLDPKPSHASAAAVSVNRTDVLANTEDLKVGIEITQKGQAVTVSGTIGYKSTFVEEN